MKIARHRIAAALADKTLSAQDIAAYLITERRTGELNSLMRDIMQIRADKGIVEVIAATAHPLTAEAKINIEKTVRSVMPTAKTVIITERHYPDVVGGVRLEMANERLDLSIRNKLNKFKQSMTAGKV